MRSGSAFVRLALGFRTGGLRGAGGGAACCRTLYAGRRTQDAVKPGIHGVGTQWIRGSMAFHGVRRRDPGGGAGELGVAGTG